MPSEIVTDREVDKVPKVFDAEKLGVSDAETEGVPEMAEPSTDSTAQDGGDPRLQRQ